MFGSAKRHSPAGRAIWEGFWQAHFADFKHGVIERLTRLGEQIPPDVELGYHLCYGDYGHQPFKQPADSSNLIEVANAIAARIRRPINWIHFASTQES